MTETQRSSWDELGRPAILFERHLFHKWTKGAYGRSHPDLSNQSSGGYGRYREQYDKLYRAAVLNEEAALKSASWGAFQILGENHVAAGYGTVDAFVDAMLSSERNHLKSFVSFVAHHPRMKEALQKKEWATFASLYNGPKYKENEYDTKMPTNYDNLKKLSPKK